MAHHTQPCPCPACLDQAARRAERDRAIVAAVFEGETMRAVADRMGCSTQLVYLAVRQGRAAYGRQIVPCQCSQTELIPCGLSAPRADLEAICYLPPVAQLLYLDELAARAAPYRTTPPWPYEEALRLRLLPACVKRLCERVPHMVRSPRRKQTRFFPSGTVNPAEKQA